MAREHMNNTRLPPSQAMGKQPLCTPDMDHGPSLRGTYACHGYTPKGCIGANSHGFPYLKLPIPKKIWKNDYRTSIPHWK